MGDMQISAEYIAYNLHNLYSISGGLQPALLSHSQGGPDSQWALRFWPSTRNITRAFVALSPDFAGIELLDSDLSKICVGDLCQASLWQQSAGSNYYNAMHADTFQAQVPTTAVWTEYDSVVTPPGNNAQLPGATVYSVQQLCPGRLTNHITMTIDSAGWAFAIDALNNGGTASISRVRSKLLSTCLSVTGPHMSPTVATSLTSLFNDLVDGIILGQPRVTQEPAVDTYAINPTSTR